MPPVSSRTTSRSVPSTTSRRSGLASSSASTARTGRRLAYRPSALRRPSRPCSGRGASGSVRVPLRAADGGQQDGVGRAAGGERLVGQRRAVGVDRGAAERVLGEREVAQRATRSSSVGAVISGPIPSPEGRRCSQPWGGQLMVSAQSMTDVTDEAQRLREQLEAERRGPPRGRAPRGRERAPALRPPGRARAAGDGGRRLQRGDRDRAGAGRRDRPRLRAHALAGRARLPRRSGHRRPAPQRHLVPRGRGALRRVPRGQRGPRRSSRGCRRRHGHAASRRG